MADLVTIIDKDNLLSKVYLIERLEKNKRRQKAVELASEYAKETSEDYKGKIALEEFADMNRMTIIAFERLK